MSLFLLELPCNAPIVRTRRCLVEADTVGKAREMAEKQFDGDGSWGDATSTVVSKTGLPDFMNWIFAIHISVPPVPPGVPQPDLVASVTGAPGDGWNEIAAKMVIALNALTPIANAAYDVATRVLTVAAIADGLGDRKVQVRVTPPGAAVPFVDQTGGVFVQSITDGGIAAADLTVTLPGGPDYENWVINCRVTTAAVDVSVTGGAGDNLKDLLDDLVVALNGTAINAAAYDAATEILTVAGAADGIGNDTVFFDLYAPGAPKIDRISDVLVSVTDGGLAGDALTAQFKDRNRTIPFVLPIG